MVHYIHKIKFILSNIYLLGVPSFCVVCPSLYLKDADVQAFLEEATVLDPKFKTKLDREEIWDRVGEAAEATVNEVSEFDNPFDCSEFLL